MTFWAMMLAAVLAVAAVLPAETRVAPPHGLTEELAAEMPEPAELALLLNEEDFEDYLDMWLENEQIKFTNTNASQIAARNGGCTIRVNGDLGQPQPVYLRNKAYLQPTGTTGQIHLNSGEQMYIACPGSGRNIRHSNIVSTISQGAVSCVNNALVQASWLQGNSDFGGLTCSSNAFHNAEITNSRCWNNNIVIRVGYIVNNEFHHLYWSCFDQNRLEVIYVWYEQNPSNAVHQSGVARPNWLDDSFYPGVVINNLYTQVSQKEAIARLVGQSLADKYVTSQQFLARGHLAAKTDFIFATGQRASFYFINAAPQWQPFNAGNWNSLEQNLRVRIGQAGYHTTIYTGTFGVTQLRDANNRLVDIYLHTDNNNNPQLPVPLYFYKVVYDSARNIGTAFISINNPYYTLEEAHALTFCTDRCRNNNDFNWIKWQPNRLDLGYSFCCDVNEFRAHVPHLPSFQVNGLLS